MRVYSIRPSALLMAKIAFFFDRTLDLVAFDDPVFRFSSISGVLSVGELECMVPQKVFSIGDELLERQHHGGEVAGVGLSPRSAGFEGSE